jgi:hypothetical protein
LCKVASLPAQTAPVDASQLSQMLGRPFGPRKYLIKTNMNNKNFMPYYLIHGAK